MSAITLGQQLPCGYTVITLDPETAVDLRPGPTYGWLYVRGPCRCWVANRELSYDQLLRIETKVARFRASNDQAKPEAERRR